jgi:hypothetical protein
MSLSNKQKQMYWREWSSVLGYCRAHGLTQPDRHQLHADTLGTPARLLDPQSGHVSMLKFQNHDFDAILAAFRAIYRPADLAAQLEPDRQKRLRMLKKVEYYRDLLSEALGSDNQAEHYIIEICRDKFHAEIFTDLDNSQLVNLLRTLGARCQTKIHHPEPQPA